MAVTIYHNPRCSKSRQALQLLRDRGIEPEIVDYLKTPPSADEIDAVLSKLGLKPRAAMRAKEAAYREAGMADESLSRRALIDLMAANPIVIERPPATSRASTVVPATLFGPLLADRTPGRDAGRDRGEKSGLCHPPENVLSIL